LLDTIKSYLISLGFDVDKKSYDDTKKATDELDKGIKEMAGSAIKNFAAAGVAVATFLVSANAGIAKFISNLASADLQSEMLARQLWTSRDQAESFKKTLDAMGVTLEQLYLSPELAARFRELRSEVEGIRPPAEFRSEMRFIRDIQFEFTRFKLSAQYALQWVGHYFVKYLSGPLHDAQKRMQDFNKKFRDEMPVWAERVGRFLASFVNAGRHVVEFFADIKSRIADLLDSVPTNVKGAAAALGGLALLLTAGPFGQMIAMLTLGILLIDDFYTYLEGGESAFGPMWDKLLEFKNEMADAGVFEGLQKAFDGLMESASDLLISLGDLSDALMGKDGEEGLYGAFKSLGELGLDGLTKALEGIRDIVNTITASVEAVTALLNGDFGDWVADNGDKQKDALIESGEASADEGFFGNMWKGFTSGITFDTDEVYKRWGILFGDISKGIFGGGSDNKDSEDSGDNQVTQNAFNMSSYLGVEQMKRVGDETKAGNKSLQTIADGSRFLSNIANGINTISSLMSTGSGGAGAYSYWTPQYNNQNSQVVTLNQTNNVYGSDPQITGRSIVDSTAVLTRNLRGWG
jgi:hypothetical protein